MIVASAHPICVISQVPPQFAESEILNLTFKFLFVITQPADVQPLTLVVFADVVQFKPKIGKLADVTVGVGVIVFVGVIVLVGVIVFVGVIVLVGVIVFVGVVVPPGVVVLVGVTVGVTVLVGVGDGHIVEPVITPLSFIP